jgi:hypothetical protein
MPAERAAPGRSLDDRQLAQLSGMVLDQPGTIQVDKIIHFSGYAILASVFVMALRPAHFLPVLAALLGIGLAIEYLQPLMGRERDLRDVVANTLGVAVGAGAGLLVRGGYAWLRRDLALSVVSRKRLRCRAGTVLLRAGEPVHAIHIIQSGEVKVTRLVEGSEREFARLGPGDVFGLIGLIQGTPQYATVTAQTPVTLYRLSLEELIETSGGAGQPVASVLQAAARMVRTLADRTADPTKIV